MRYPVKIVGHARTSEMKAIPEPFLPNQLNAGLAFLVEPLCIFHLFRLFIARTQQVGDLDRALDVRDEYPLIVSHKSIYLFFPVRIIDTRYCNHQVREYRESMR